MTPKELAIIAAKALDEKKGKEMSAIEITDLTTLADYFVIASGTSNTQINALCDAVEKALKEQAESLAQAAFDSSEESKTLQEVTLDQIAATRDSIAAMGSLEGALHSYNVSQEGSKGMGAKNLAALSSSEDAPEQVKTLWRDMQAVGAGEWGSPSAVGLDRVPYDNYPALLHEGERVLTAQQAREADRGSGGGESINITVNVDGSGGDGEELADQIADIIVQRLELARMRG